MATATAATKKRQAKRGPTSGSVSWVLTHTYPITTKAAEAAWASLLEDPWALLNTSPETIRQAAAASGQSYPPGQVGDLLGLLEGLRQMFTWAATGAIFDLAGNLHEDKEGRENLSDFWRVEAKVGEVLGRHYGGYRMAFAPSPAGYQPGWRSLGTVDAPAPSVFSHLACPLFVLLSLLENATPSTVYVCEVCGRIGPAAQANRRFCGPTCRQRAYRARRS